ncbi:uncharacterized protein I303_103100 [Kwoniella dejecticola CBS 10117]|uniref:Cytoplasmic tRNA 2-thiolation protein 2 n=1 Tax=Kwoniella dejecticola CBS 10117 TaxID=1296121 RepID=A0A1A6AAL2_9TREE|nr:uncharacterized protein I303_03120 [Kwoniella dejecticola CBS 10117]OBR87096.1 hypothetical protein I303_03120 [Kwoniella dejecticola CBS 10117]
MSCGDIPDGLTTTEEQGEALMPRKKKVQRVDKSLCQKCKESKSMYIIRNVTYCKTCFEVSVFTRFTRTLHPILKTEAAGVRDKEGKKARIALNQGGTRPNPTNGSVVVGLSGGASSMTLLDLLVDKEYIGKGDDKVIDRTKGEKQPVWNKGYIVHVDFSDLIEDTHTSSPDRSEVLKQWIEGKENGLVWIGLKAHDVYDANLTNKIRRIAGLPETQEDASSGLKVDLKNPDLPLFPIPSSSSSTPTPLAQLRTILATLPPASRPSFLSSILDSLIGTAAEIIPSVSHVLLGETSTRQAQRLISGTALGKGYTLPLELAVTNKPMCNAKYTILKPMKEITIKEVAIYTHLKGLNGVVRNDRKWDYSGPISKKDSRGKDHTRSLESLTEQFIASLGVTHPATVSTINRTGDKLTFTGEKEKGVSCPVCQMPVDPNALEWKSRTALTALPEKTQTDHERNGTNAELDEKDSLATMLCYACLTTFTPPTVVSKAVKQETTPVRLPLWVEQNLRRRKEVDRDGMRDEIKDFLIGEE